MADNVGGISVSFIADATQLKSELQALETRLKAFNTEHAQQRVKLNADLVMPGDRRMQDFRRDVQQGVNSTSVQVKVQLQAPDAGVLDGFRNVLQQRMNARPVRIPVELVMPKGVPAGSAGGAIGGAVGGAAAGGAPHSLGSAVARVQRGNVKTAQDAATERRELAVAAPNLVDARNGVPSVGRGSAATQRANRTLAAPLSETRSIEDIRAYKGHVFTNEMQRSKDAERALFQQVADERRRPTGPAPAGAPPRIRPPGVPPAAQWAGSRWQLPEGAEPVRGQTWWNQPGRRPGAPAGGARGFAASPEWLKAKPSYGPDRNAPGIARLMDELPERGRPGVHIENPRQQYARSPQHRYTVARNEEGEALGALQMTVRGHKVEDVMPYVNPAARRQGIGTRLYSHAQKAGFDVERASDRNAAQIKGLQTEEGEALWQARKRAMGVDPNKAIAAAERAARVPMRRPEIRFTGPREPEPAPLTNEEWAQLGAQNGWSGGGARGFAAGGEFAASGPAGGTSAARGKGRRAPNLEAGEQIAKTIRPRGGESVANLILQTAAKTGTPPPMATTLSRIRSVLPQMSAGSKSRGERWYPEANKALKSMRKAYGLEKQINDAQLSAMAGIFSGNADWPQNLRLLSGVFQRMSRGVSTADPEKFLGIGTFPDLIVKAVQVAQMKDPTLAQIAARRDVQTGDQFLRRQPGKGTFFGPKTGPFTGALHAGGGKKAEAEARGIWKILAPIDRWMARGLHGIEGVGTKAHPQGQEAIAANVGRSGMSSDFAFQAALWDHYGPAQAAADPFDGRVAHPLEAAGRTPPTRLSTLNAQLERARAAKPAADKDDRRKQLARIAELKQAAANEKKYASTAHRLSMETNLDTINRRRATGQSAPETAAMPMAAGGARGYAAATSQRLMVSPGDRLDPVSLTPTLASMRADARNQERELTPSEYASRQRRVAQNREDAQWARLRQGPVNRNQATRIEQAAAGTAVGGARGIGGMGYEGGGADMPARGGYSPHGGNRDIRAGLSGGTYGAFGSDPSSHGTLLGMGHLAVRDDGRGGRVHGYARVGGAPPSGTATPQQMANRAAAEPVPVEEQIARLAERAAGERARIRGAGGSARDRRTRERIEASARGAEDEALRLIESVTPLSDEERAELSTPMDTGTGHKAQKARQRRRRLEARGRIAPDGSMLSEVGEAVSIRPVSTEGWDLNNINTPAIVRKAARDAAAPAPVAATPTKPRLATIAGATTSRRMVERGYVSGGAQEVLESGGKPQPSTGGLPGGGPGRDVYATPTLHPQVAALLGTIEQGRFGLQEARGAGQVRAAGTTAASQIAAVAGGRGQDVVRLNQVNAILGKMEKVVLDNKDAFTDLDAAREKFTAGSKELKYFEDRVTGVNKQVKDMSDEVGRLMPNKYKQMAIGMGSAIGGTIIGMTLLQTVMGGLEKVGQSLDPVIDRMTGFRMSAERVAPELGKAARQFNGYAEGAVAATMAQTGLGGTAADQVAPLLEQRAAIEGGNAAFKEQIDLLRTAQYFAREPNAGITKTTGGFMGTPIGGQAPYYEQLLQNASPIGGPMESDLLAQVGAGAGIGAGIGAAAGIAVPFMTPLGGAAIGAAVGGLVAATEHAMEVVTGTDTSSRGKSLSGRYASYMGGDNDAITEREVDDIRTFQQAVNSGNEAAQRAAPEIAAVAKAVSYLGDSSEEAQAAVDATQKMLEEMDAPQGQRDAARDMRFAYIDPRTGAPITNADTAREHTEAVLQGFTEPDPKQVARQSVKALAAQLQMTQWSGERQRDVMNPGATFTSLLAQGRISPTGTTRRQSPWEMRSRGPQMVSPELAAQYGIDQSRTLEAGQQLEGMAQAGALEMNNMMGRADKSNRALGLVSNLAADFKDATNAAAGTATEIRAINKENQKLQLGAQLRQINEQVRVASQTLGDARSFISGQASPGPGGGALGVLQHEARQLDVTGANIGFERTDLGLARNQRQINVQQALAASAAPGATGHQRAAMIEYQQLEADYAQRDQDLAVEQAANERAKFGNQQEQITISAARAVETLNEQLGIMNENAYITVKMTHDAETLDKLEGILAEQMANVTSLIDQANATEGAFAQQAASMVASIAGFMDEHTKVLIDGISDFLKETERTLEEYTPGGNYRSRTLPKGSTDYTGGNQRTDGGPQAAGMLQGFSSPTQLTVGEAGAETVAILRNPRIHTMQPQGGGGAVNVNVTVTGNTIGGNEGDVESFAAMIARKVEETLSRRASLQGLRNV